jgi:hypothetical protein
MRVRDDMRDVVLLLREERWGWTVDVDVDEDRAVVDEEVGAMGEVGVRGGVERELCRRCDDNDVLACTRMRRQTDIMGDGTYNVYVVWFEVVELV